MKSAVVIVAGGSGTRMGSDVPKQFLLLGDKPVLMHTIEVFHRFEHHMQIILVLPQSQFDYWQSLCNKHQFDVPFELTYGGETRFQSVKNGLELVRDAEVVAIHDGVRPFVSKGTLQRCYHDAEEFGNAIPVIPVHESVRQIIGNKSITVDRSLYKLVQTPQVFLRNSLVNAYQVDYDPSFTDDASVFENAGHLIHMVEGNRENIKITEPIDLLIGKAFLGLDF